jgi:hypothetical protein
LCQLLGAGQRLQALALLIFTIEQSAACLVANLMQQRLRYVHNIIVDEILTRLLKGKLRPSSDAAFRVKPLSIDSTSRTTHSNISKFFTVSDAKLLPPPFV